MADRKVVRVQNLSQMMDDQIQPNPSGVSQISRYTQAKSRLRDNSSISSNRIGQNPKDTIVQLPDRRSNSQDHSTNYKLRLLVWNALGERIQS